jgi:hypothetical protein
VLKLITARLPAFSRAFVKNMRLHHHTAISITISGFLYMIFKSWGLAAASLISGILIDLDHLFDYTYEHGQPFNIRDFFRVCHNCQFNRIFLLLHAWEWVALLGIAAWLSGWNPWVTGVLIGFGQHILLDTVHNGSGLRSYFLYWRWKNDFVFDRIFHHLRTYKYEYRDNLLTDPNTD